MNLVRKPGLVARAALLAAFLLTGAQLALAQLPPPPPPGVVLHLPEKPDPSIKVPQFDVISVRPSKDNETRVQFTPDGMRGTSVTIHFLLFEGFGIIGQNQVIGEPSWSTTEGFDLQAKVAAVDVPTLGRMTFEQRATMFQQILADRFKLVVHHETRQLPIYQLAVAKNGSRLKQSAPDDPTATTPRQFMMFGPGKVTATDQPVVMLLKPLSRQLGRVVVDQTGLTGNYDFTLEWTPEGGAPSTAGGSQSGATPPDGSSPDLFTAVREQLGLTLSSAKGPVDVIVIDHIEKASAN